jgi:hypothetical protein
MLLFGRVEKHAFPDTIGRVLDTYLVEVSSEIAH